MSPQYAAWLLPFAAIEAAAGDRLIAELTGVVVALSVLDEIMINDLVAWCDEQGCVGIDAMALPGHRATKNFFEESGFTARKLVMHKNLEGGR